MPLTLPAPSRPSRASCYPDLDCISSLGLALFSPRLDFRERSNAAHQAGKVVIVISHAVASYDLRVNLCDGGHFVAVSISEATARGASLK